MPNESPLIEIRVAYKDYESIEPATGRKRDKFKVAGKSLSDLGIYTFFIVNSLDTSLIKILTVKIFKQDWEQREMGELENDVSYIDISDCESFNELQILEKRKDPQNGFPPKARLCQFKFDKLCKTSKILRNPLIRQRVSRETQKLICSALGVSDELRIKLGL